MQIIADVYPDLILLYSFSFPSLTSRCLNMKQNFWAVLRINRFSCTFLHLLCLALSEPFYAPFKNLISWHLLSEGQWDSVS